MSIAENAISPNFTSPPKSFTGKQVACRIPTGHETPGAEKQGKGIALQLHPD
jgi:hypothetical protein